MKNFLSIFVVMYVLLMIVAASQHWTIYPYLWIPPAIIAAAFFLFILWLLCKF